MQHFGAQPSRNLFGESWQNALSLSATKVTSVHMSNRLPHICFVAPNAYPALTGDERSQVIGGAEVQQAIIARYLVARGYIVSMVCLDFGQEAVVDIDGIRVFRAYEPEEGIPIIRFLWPRITSLWKCMKRANADIYYQRTASMVTGLVAEFCRRNQRKSIFAGSGNPNFERNTTRIEYRRNRWLFEYGLMRVDRILVQNAEQARLCLKNFSRESTLVPNCYEAPTQQQTARGTAILWVGTIRQIKRPQLLLDVAAALPQYQFRMVGGPATRDAGMFASIKARSQTIGNVDFVGFVPSSKVDKYFDGAALLVNTSESEGFPNTFLQAWSRGIVTVSTVDCGARLNGVPVGHIVNSVDEMVAVITELMASEDRRHEEGSLCREYFQENHTPERVVDLYQTIFSELLAS
jgi:glycosyltransferase involved in cell wall biosynthesis